MEPDSITPPPGDEGPNPEPMPEPSQTPPGGKPAIAEPADATVEELLRDIAQRLATLEARLGEALAAAARVEQLQRIDLAVRMARASDIPAATDAVEQVMRQRNLQDVSDALAEVRRLRPGLFRSPGGASPMAAGMEAAALGPGRPASGDRRALMDYMRARRG